MNVAIFIYTKERKSEKAKMLEFHSFINDVINLFAVLGHSFQILEVYFLKKNVCVCVAIYM